MFGVASTVTGWFSGASKDEKKAIEMQQRQSQESNAAAQKLVDDRRQQYNQEGGPVPADVENQNGNGEAGGPIPDDDGLMARDMFIKIEKRREKYFQTLEEEDRDVVDTHKSHVPRRWAVRIWNVQIESLVKEDVLGFINLNWGGDRLEARIRTGQGVAWWDVLGDSEVVWGMGDDPLCFRSDVMVIKEKSRVTFKNEFSFEWTGSYSQLGSQNLVIEFWRYNKYKANTLDSGTKDTLVSYATGPVFQEKTLTKISLDDSTGEKELPSRFKMTFQIYFQELYDFELNFTDLQAFGLMGHNELARAGPRDFANQGRLVVQQDTTQSLLAESEGSSSDEEVLDTQKSTLQRGAGQMGSMMTDRGVARRSGTRLDLSDQKKVVRKLSPTKKKLRTKRRVDIEILHQGFGDWIKKGPMHIKSEFRRASENEATDRWGSIGKIYYRGTLADLDNDLVRLKFYEQTNLAGGSTLVAEAAVSLRGVHEYGTVTGSCTVPRWVVEKSKSSGRSAEELKIIKKSTVGRFETKISVDNLPKFKQSGELCDMIPEKAYLLVKVLRVDRLAIPDQRPINQCDSAVQVQFSGNSYETEVRQDTISPQFNQEFYFELKTDNPSEFSPDELAAMHGPIIFDVWLRSDDEGAVTAEHVGHAQCSILDIFAEGKPETKTHNSIRTGEVSEYRTAVLKARKKLTCLWTQTSTNSSGATILVPSSALAPSFLYVDVWLRPFDFLAIGGKIGTTIADAPGAAATDPALPPRVRSEFFARAKIWDSMANMMTRKFIACTNRFFHHTANSQDRDEHLLPMFLDVIRPPEILSNPKAIAFWVHCLSHTTMDDLKAVVPFWSTPDFTLSLGKGDTFAHAILHASMLRGLSGSSLHPFVCIGTGWDGSQIAWVMTMHEDGSVVMWDTANNRKFRLPNRCADVGRCGKVVRGVRFPGQLIGEPQIEAEVRRRQRLVKQDLNLVKMKKVDPELFYCDAKLFRAPEILKLYDPKVHHHALVWSSTVPMESSCFQCGMHPEKRMTYGFICNKTVSTNPEFFCEDTNKFLCSACARVVQYHDESPLPKKRDGSIDVVLPPAKFAETPILPYRSIDIIFDQTNIWLNLQHFSPATIMFDLWNPLYWHVFTTCPVNFRTFTNASKGLRKAKSREYFFNIKNRILSKLKKSILAIRRNGNLSTYIHRDPLLESHLETGMELQFQKELLDESSDLIQKSELTLASWKIELYSKVPPRHRLVGHTFLFSFFDSIEISRIVTEKINFLNFRENGTQFAIAAFIGKLPNSVTACYVYVGIVFPLSDSILRQSADTRRASVERDPTTTSHPTPFTDETLEQQRLFTLRTQVFDSDTDFIQQMRNDLYKDVKNEAGGGGSLVLKQNANSRPPRGDFVRSQVDYPRGPNDQRDDDENDPLLTYLDELGTEDPVEAAPAPTDGEPSNYLTELFQKSNFAPTLPEFSLPTSPTAVSYLTNLLTSKPSESSAHNHYTHPTPEDLNEIYKPQTVQRPLGHRQFLRHVPTGFSVPIPSQQRMREVVELGAEDMTTKVRVETAQDKVVKKIVRKQLEE